jgi:hypothetical protein
MTATKGMDQAETFTWLAERHRELLAVEAALREMLCLDRNDEESSWWLPAEPGPIECDTLAEAIKEYIELTNRDDAKARAEIAKLEAENIKLNLEIARLSVAPIVAREAQAEHITSEITDLRFR